MNMLASESEDVERTSEQGQYLEADGISNDRRAGRAQTTHTHTCELLYYMETRPPANSFGEMKSLIKNIVLKP